MSDLDKALEQLKELRQEVFMLIGRVARLEERVELAIDAPPIIKNVVPPSVVGTAAALGAELADVRRDARGIRESAQGLRRVVAPSEDDTVKVKTGAGRER